MNKFQEKQNNRTTRNQQPLICNNKNLPRNSKPKPNKDKVEIGQHKYPTRLNTKHKNKKAEKKVQEPQQKQQIYEQTKSTEQTEESQTLLHPIQKSNPQLQDFKLQILQYVSQRENLIAFDPKQLRSHKTLGLKLRTYLVRHFFKIYLRFQLKRTTLHLAVHYMDLYFCRKQYTKDQLETITIAQTCLFIAMKYQEIYPPELTSWVDNRQIPTVIRLEAQVLHVLDFQLAHYTLQHFKDIVLWESSQSTENEDQQASQLHLLVDLTLFDLNIRDFKPAKLASCIHDLTRKRGQQKDENKIGLNVKWMIQRNQESVAWLIQQKYSRVIPTHLC